MDNFKALPRLSEDIQKMIDSGAARIGTVIRARGSVVDVTLSDGTAATYASMDNNLPVNTVGVIVFGVGRNGVFIPIDMNYPVGRYIWDSDTIVVGKLQSTTVASGISRGVSIGYLNEIQGTSSVAIGYDAKGFHASVAIGQSTRTNWASTAVGYGVNATGDSAAAYGRNSVASGAAAFAAGYEASASAANTIAIGRSASSSGNHSVAVGRLSNVTGPEGAAVGNSASAWEYGTAMGGGAGAAGTISSAFGYVAYASGSYSTAVGYDARATNTNAMCIGRSSRGSGQESTAVGYDAQSGGNYSVAVGQGSRSSGTASVALGPSANTNGCTWGIAIGPSASNIANYDAVIAASTLRIVPTSGRLYSKLGLRRLDGTQVYLYVDNSNALQINTSW